MKSLQQRKILIVATSDVGGAGEYMLKIAKYYFENGYFVKMLVKEKTKHFSFIIQYVKVEPLYKKIFDKIRFRVALIFFPTVRYNPKYSFFSTDEIKQNICLKTVEKIIGFQPEFVFSGWTAGFLNSTDLLRFNRKFGTKIYTVHADMNHYTGGCHYAWECTRYQTGCDNKCPAIITTWNSNLPKKNFDKKLANARLGDFNILVGSKFDLVQVKNSKIYQHQKEFQIINSLIDINIMNSKYRNIAKSIFGLQEDIFYIFIGATDLNDPRKGFEYLIDALNISYERLGVEQVDKIRVLIVSNKFVSIENIPFKTQIIDYITDYRLLALLYQATDVFVCSSIQDSGPMMVAEALACGTPVIAFNIGIASQLVKTGNNGYKAKLRCSTDLARGIIEIICLSKHEYQLYSKNASYEAKINSSIQSIASVFDKLIDKVNKSNFA